MVRSKLTKRREKVCCQQVIRLLLTGGKVADVARRIGCSEQDIRQWMGQAGRAERRSTPRLSASEREELARLRVENRQLKEELNTPLRSSLEGVRAPHHVDRPRTQDDAPIEEDLAVWLRGLT